MTENPSVKSVSSVDRPIEHQTDKRGKRRLVCQRCGALRNALEHCAGCEAWLCHRCYKECRPND